MPALTTDDVHREQKLFGYPPGYEWGKLAKRKVSWAIVDDDLVMDRKK